MRSTVVRRGLRRSLRLGAAWDVLLGLWIVVGGSATLTALGYAAPASPFHFRLAALPLFVLPALYVAAASAGRPDPFRMPVLWARWGGGAILILLALLSRPDALWIYLAVGFSDLAWGLVHAALWRR